MLQYNEKEPLIAIGTVAKMLKIHQRTLRIYDEIGILRPERSGKNRRLYSIEDCRLAQIITFLTRNLGINLAGVKLILEITKDIDNKERLEFLLQKAQNSNIDETIQKENFKKYSKRGRKKIN
ncbi:MAG: MerR family transcriptional regulator [Candidatus Gastranaerophilales bacterium]|nr:MerR family transcriptional regulator [Candidatus Gastranaerophilales bacterium]